MRLRVPRYEDGVVGLPTRAFVLSNSERGVAWCPRRWWLQYVERLHSEPSLPLRFGRAWHNQLEDVYRWWMEHDTAYPGDGIVCVWCNGSGCARCDDTGLGPVERYRAVIEGAITDDGYPLVAQEDIDRDVTRLARVLSGWLHVHGAAPPDNYRVVGVEVAIARCILNPRTGHPYTPETYVVRLADRSLRLAGTGEASGEVPLPPGAELLVKTWPWYQVARLDTVLQHRRTGKLLVGEFKSARDPRGKIDSLSNDTQTPGYAWVLAGCASELWLGDAPVAGFVYDVASSAYQQDPALLKPTKVKTLDDAGEPIRKGRSYVYELDDAGEPVLRSPGLSRDTRKTIPTWRYEAAIGRHGFDRADYADVLLELETRDAKLYIREQGAVSPESQTRYAQEVYADAVRFAAWRRDAARATKNADLHVAFPRQPVCTAAGLGCSFRGPCAQDGPDARSSFTTASGPMWLAEQITMGGT